MTQTPPDFDPLELVAHYRALARTPLSQENAVALRREGREGLAKLGQPNPFETLARRRRWSAVSRIREAAPRERGLAPLR
jgi:hypothetical protein